MSLYDPLQVPDYAAFAVELDVIAALADHAGDTATAAHLHHRAQRLRWASATPPEGEDDDHAPRWH